MTGRKFRALTFGLLASTAIGTPALAQTSTSDSPAPATNATDVTGETPQEQTANDGQVEDPTEIVVTAQKREENLQDVPVSIQAMGTRRLDQLNISSFEDYTKQLPSVSFQASQGGGTVVYMRGVATGGDGNHSGSLPSVGTYLDEQPVTTIGGNLDVHIYDIARSKVSRDRRARYTARRARPAPSASSPTSPNWASPAGASMPRSTGWRMAGSAAAWRACSTCRSPTTSR